MVLNAQSLPAAFVGQMQDILGEESEAFFQALSEPSPVSVRINPAKTRAGQEEALLPAPSTDRVPWCPYGRYLSERPSFTFDPAFHAGAYYVQEASSMYLWTVLQEAFGYLEADAPLTALDLCAAPGGKSTLLLDALPNGSILVANEIQRQRANVLAENLAKWGHPGTIVTQADPAAIGALFPSTAFPGGAFDLMLTDVPCSGEGMFRKEADALRDWSPEAVTACQQRQRRILQSAWPALRPGGILIYSTCTFNRAENEDNVRWIAQTLGAREISIRRFFFHRSRGEGLFMALLQKNEDKEAARSRIDPVRDRRREQRPAIPGCVTGALSWLQQPGDYTPIILPDCSFSAASPLIADMVRLLAKNRIPMLMAGIPLGELKGRDLVPDTALALSTALDRSQLPCHELDREQALRFLRREALVLPATAPKGLTVVTHGGLPLGFVRQLGNRANNLYPAHWRIRSSID
ncbi:MAG: hypothetical protein ILP04_07270 [Bacteroidales bacterium]|nr:hypothetical protein [Bacteroidales bacterium]